MGECLACGCGEKEAGLVATDDAEDADDRGDETRWIEAGCVRARGTGCGAKEGAENADECVDESCWVCACAKVTETGKSSIVSSWTSERNCRCDMCVMWVRCSW